MGVCFALVGNPNVGKTAIFNALTGLSLTTGNYPGHTVEQKIGALNVAGLKGHLIDLPGSYSLAARSPDEILLADVVLNQLPGVEPVDGLIVIVDASNLERNLYFASQLLELGKPTVLVLNMMDIAKKRAIEIDTEKLSQALGLPVIATQAHRRIGIDELKQALTDMAEGKIAPATCTVTFPDEQRIAVEELDKFLASRKGAIGRDVPHFESFRLLVDEGGYAERRLTKKIGDDFRDTLAEIRKKALSNGHSLAAQEARARYDWVRGVLDAAVTRPDLRPDTGTDKIDAILTHKIFGSAIFLVLMAVVFQSIYTWAGPFMDFIDGSVGALGAFIGARLPEGMLQSLVVDGIIAGVGSVVIFLPQILLLTLFIALLEDCGYMARAAFLMDKVLSWCGLSGQSFIPMMSSFACAIPGIMATRTISNSRDRLTTILVAPLMSCSARLPVYVIMIAAFVPDRPLLGGIMNLQGATLLCMYLLGIFVAVPVAWTFKKLVFKGETPPFVLEMPTYKMPQFRTVFNKLYIAGREFIIRAGTLIFAVTIIVWALAYFPRSEAVLEKFEAQRQAATQAMPAGPELEERLAHINNEESGELLRNSILGRVGRAVEPLFVPLGWDWRIATATIASFPAREVIVATLGTLFNLGADETEESEGLLETLRAATWPDGRPLFNIPVALSIMVFFALCCQCAATLAVIKRETGKWRWPVIAFTYMTIIAYIAALITYQASSLILG